MADLPAVGRCAADLDLSALLHPGARLIDPGGDRSARSTAMATGPELIRPIRHGHRLQPDQFRQGLAELGHHLGGRLAVRGAVLHPGRVLLRQAPVRLAPRVARLRHRDHGRAHPAGGDTAVHPDDGPGVGRQAAGGDHTGHAVPLRGVLDDAVPLLGVTVRTDRSGPGRRRIDVSYIPFHRTSGGGTGCGHAVPVLVRDAVDDVLLALHRAQLREPHLATGRAVPPGDLLHRLFACHGRGLPGHVPIAGDLRDRWQTTRGRDHVRRRQRLKPLQLPTFVRISLCRPLPGHTESPCRSHRPSPYRPPRPARCDSPADSSGAWPPPPTRWKELPPRTAGGTPSGTPSAGYRVPCAVARTGRSPVTSTTGIARTSHSSATSAWMPTGSPPPGRGWSRTGGESTKPVWTTTRAWWTSCSTPASPHGSPCTTGICPRLSRMTADGRCGRPRTGSLSMQPSCTITSVTGSGTGRR